jgi:hypothetical protein
VTLKSDFDRSKLNDHDLHEYSGHTATNIVYSPARRVEFLIIILVGAPAFILPLAVIGLA